MNFTTLSISLGIVFFCLSFNIVNSLGNDLSGLNNNVTVVRQLNASLRYSDTGVSSSPMTANESGKYLNSLNPELSSSNGFYGYSGLTLGALVFDAILKSSVNLSSFLLQIFGITNTNTTAYYLIEFISFGVNLNHIFVILQLVIRPMGYEL